MAKSEPKRGRGAPPKYKTAADLERAVEKYFDGNDAVPTVAGLALALGFCDRSSMYNQKDRGDDFSHVIKKAMMRIESFHEMALSGRNPTGHIFWLKNHGGYSDTHKLDLPAGPIMVVHDYGGN